MLFFLFQSESGLSVCSPALHSKTMNNANPVFSHAAIVHLGEVRK